MGQNAGAPSASGDPKPSPKTKYYLLRTGPVGPSLDEDGSTHLARHARKWADWAKAGLDAEWTNRRRLIDLEANEARKHRLEADPVVGLAMTVVGDRGSGKTTWLNHFKENLSAPDPDAARGEQWEWLHVTIDLEVVAAAQPPRPQALLFHEISRTLADEEQRLCTRQQELLKEQGWEPEKARKAKKELCDHLAELHKAAGMVRMDEEAARMAALAFATDLESFTTGYAKLSQDAGSAFPRFQKALGQILTETRTRLLLVLDDCDLWVDGVDPLPLLLAGARLAEEAPVVRVATTSEDGVRYRLLGQLGGRGAQWWGAARRLPSTSGGRTGDEQWNVSGAWQGLLEPVERGQLTWRVLGTRVTLAKMNELRKASFLLRPLQTEGTPNGASPRDAGLVDGRAVWAEALRPDALEDGAAAWSPSDGNRARRQIVEQLLAGDWQSRVSPRERVREYLDLLDLEPTEATDAAVEAAVTKASEKLEAYVKSSPERCHDLHDVLSVFPSNHREAVLLTNSLIQQREQVIGQDRQPFDRLVTWTTYEERLYRAMMCLAYLRWPTSALADLLWFSPADFWDALYKRCLAIEDHRSEEPPGEITVKMGQQKAPVIQSKLQDLVTELSGREYASSKEQMETVLRLCARCAKGPPSRRGS